MKAITTRPETQAEKLARLQRSLDYNESKHTRANGIAAAALRRQIRALVKEMEVAK